MDDFSDELIKRLGLAGVSPEVLQELYEDWSRLAQATPEDSRDPTNAAFVEAFEKLGVRIEPVGLVALKIAVTKQVKNLGLDPDNWEWEEIDKSRMLEEAASFGAAYMLGFLEAVKQREDENPFELIEAAVESVRSQKKTARLSEIPVPDESKITELKTTEEIGEFLREQARNMMEVFDEPDDDWAPVLFVVSESKTAMIGLEMPEDEQTKEMLFKVAIPATVRANFRKDKPKAMGMVVSTWTLNDEVPANQEWFRKRATGEIDGNISDHPEREEMLVCFLSDSKHDEIWMAQIYRDGEQGPGLGEWKQKVDTSDEEIRLSGNIPRMMQRLLR